MHHRPAATLCGIHRSPGADRAGLQRNTGGTRTGAILGAAVLGIEGGQVMALPQLSMIGNVPYDQPGEAVYAHATLAESLNNLFSMLEP